MNVGANLNKGVNRNPLLIAFQNCSQVDFEDIVKYNAYKVFLKMVLPALKNGIFLWGVDL